MRCFYEKLLFLFAVVLKEMDHRLIRQYLDCTTNVFDVDDVEENTDFDEFEEGPRPKESQIFDPLKEGEDFFLLLARISSCFIFLQPMLSLTFTNFYGIFL